MLSVCVFAQADEQDVAPNQSSGYQLAHRLVVKEKEREIPSRALWMSNRVVRNSRNLAFFRDDESGDRTPSQKN